MRTARIIAALVVVLTATTLGEVPNVAPSFAFNGKDLTGFYTYLRYEKFDDPDQVFTVRDGMLRISGEEAGGIATRAEFKDYHLLAEWRWGKQTWYPRRHRARNSGIMVHSRGPDGEALGIWMESLECQIIEGGTGDFILVPARGKEPPSLTSTVRFGPDKQPYYKEGGEVVTRKGIRLNWWGRDPDWRDVMWFRGREDVENPVGEWNRMEVICDGDKIICSLNGKVVNVGAGSSLKSGKILFQSEGAEIFFRKIEVRPLRK